MPLTVLITGATAGFGAAIARRIHAHDGHRVIATGRRADRLQALHAMKLGAHSAAVPARCDRRRRRVALARQPAGGMA